MNLFIDVNSNSLIRSLADNTPTQMPQLVVGDLKEINVYFVDEGAYAPFSGLAGYTVKAAVGGSRSPTGGVWTLSDEVASEVTEIPFNVTPESLRTLINPSWNIASISGVAGSFYKIQFTNPVPAIFVGDGARLTPDANVIVTDLNSHAVLVQLRQNPIAYSELDPIDDGFGGSINLLTLGAVQRLLNEGSVLDVFEVEVTTPEGIRKTYLQTGVVVNAEVIDQDAAAGIAKPTLITMAEAINMFEGTDTQKVNTEVLSANISLNEKRYQFLSASGADRTVTLPAGIGHIYQIKNIGTANSIIVNNAADVKEVRLFAGWQATLVSNADGWEVTLFIPQIYVSISDNYTVAGESFVSCTIDDLVITFPAAADYTSNTITVILQPAFIATVNGDIINATTTFLSDGTVWVQI